MYDPEEYTIDGFIDGSESEKAMYSTFLLSGGIMLGLVLPAIVYNEHKYLQLKERWDIISDYFVKSLDGKTDKENSNKLIFAQGKLSFTHGKPATDDLLGFESKDGVTLYRQVEIYQW